MNSLRALIALGAAAAWSAMAQSPRDTGSAPDPHEIPLPPIPGATSHAPGPDELPTQTNLPDIFTMNDGTQVTNAAQWAKRRVEMRRILEDYAVGHIPPPPGNVTGREIKTEIVSQGAVKYRLVQLSFGPERALALNIGIFTPATDAGPFPAVIAQAGTPPGAAPLPRLPLGPTQGKGVDVLLVTGPGTEKTDPRPFPSIPGQVTPAETAADVAAKRASLFHRGYALVVFNPNDCAEDTTLRNADGSWAFRNTRFPAKYPAYDWGVLAAWAWGVSRVADYLETDPLIDKSRLIITGASRNGKSSMIAAAFDERLMGAPVVTGGGGVGAYRFAGARKSETLDAMVKKYPNWFGPRLHDFWGRREKLPFDEHWFLALCAPRPFIALEGDADTISLPEAVRASWRGAAPAYALFNAKEKLGVNYSHHAHAFTEEDWTALMDFADVHLRGLKPTRTFDHFPAFIDSEPAAPAPAPAPPKQPAP